MNKLKHTKKLSSLTSLSMESQKSVATPHRSDDCIKANADACIIKLWHTWTPHAYIGIVLY